MANGTTTVNQKGRGGSSAHLSGRETLAIGMFVAALAVFLAATLLRVWPTTAIHEGQVIWVNLTETSALAIVMISGALGAFVHIATSFASYAGNRTLSGKAAPTTGLAHVARKISSECAFSSTVAWRRSGSGSRYRRCPPVVWATAK